MKLFAKDNMNREEIADSCSALLQEFTEAWFAEFEPYEPADMEDKDITPVAKRFCKALFKRIAGLGANSAPTKEKRQQVTQVFVDFFYDTYSDENTGMAVRYAIEEYTERLARLVYVQSVEKPYPVVFPFHAMAKAGNVRGLEALLEQIGRSHAVPILNHFDAEGRTPLHAAIQEGHGNVVELILRFGADPSLPVNDDEGFPPLYLAVLTGTIETVQCLLSAKVDPDQRSKVGFVALHEAARLRSDRIVELLIQNGATCDAVGPDGSTPLCWAVMQAHVGVARFLLHSGADSNIPGISAGLLSASDFRMTPLYVAATNESYELVKLLLSHGADPNHPHARGPGGHTALHEAARIGDIKMLELLLTADSDPSVEASDGTTPIDWAERMGHAEVAELLRKRI